MRETEKVFFMPVKCTATAIIKVVAESIEDAEIQVIENEDFPENFELVDDMQLDTDNSEYGYFEIEEVDTAQRKFENKGEW